MPDIVAISGSPTHPSRSYALLEYARHAVEAEEYKTATINIRNLPPEVLIQGQFSSPELKQTHDLVQEAKGLIIITPIYKAAYTGVLKTFLDLLPQKSLTGKIILPIATAGTIAHLLALDYTLKPVLSELGARHILGGAYILDKQVIAYDETTIQLDEEAEQRLNEQLKEFTRALKVSQPELVGSAR